MRLETDEVALSKPFVDVFGQNGHLKWFCLWSPPRPMYELSSQSEDPLWPSLRFLYERNPGYEAKRDFERRAERHMECITWHRQSAIQGRHFTMNVLSPRHVEIILKNNFKEAF